MSQERAPTKRISTRRSRQKDPYAHRGLAATVLAGGITKALRGARGRGARNCREQAGGYGARWPQKYTQCTWTREAVTTAGLTRVADVRRPLKDSPGYPSAWRSYTARTDNLREVSLEALGNKASPGEWCSLGATPVPHMRQCRHGVHVHRSVRALQEAHITRGDR